MINLGGYIELLADRMGLPKPVFTAQEEDSKEARYAKTGGQMVGYENWKTN